MSVILNFAYFFKAIVRINLQPATPVNDAQFLREYEFVLAANSSNPEQDSSGDNQMQIRIPLSVTADWKVTGKSEPAILEYNITEPRYFFLFRVKIPPYLKPNKLFTDHYTWQNFRLRILCLVNRLYTVIHKTQNS